MPEVPPWYAHFADKGLEYVQPASTFLASVSLAMYAYGFLGLIIIAIVYNRFQKIRKRRSNGKRKRRTKKSYINNANKNSNINVDPLLQQMADDQLMAKAEKKKRRNHSTNLDKNGPMAFNNRDSTNTSDLSTKHDEFES